MSLLNPRQTAFALQYAVLGNGTEAAKRAGYSAKSATTTAVYLLKLRQVQEEIQRLRAESEKDVLGVLKGGQKKAAKRLLEIVDKGADPVAVQAANEILKDVLVERRELTERRTVPPRSKEEILADIKTILLHKGYFGSNPIN